MSRQLSQLSPTKNDNCSQWSSNSLDNDANLMTTLSQNLQRYEQQYKQHTRTHKPYRIHHKPHITINTAPENKQNQYQQPVVQVKTYRKAGELYSRANSRVAKSSRPQNSELKTVKQREVKFQKRDKKKFKDRFMDIYVQLKHSKEKISLKQIDSINKQGKEEKMDLFLKLLKR